MPGDSLDNLDDFLAFLHASPTPFHAVVEARRRLEAAGFRALGEADAWDGLAPGRYHVTTSETNLIAFVLPPGAEGRTRYRIVGAHTDSPNLRLKPHAEYTSEGYAQLGVEVYGGALLNSWLDRDLGIAGRVIVREGDKEGEGFASHLVRLDRPLVRVPQLAIHLDREVNEKGLVLDRQNHLAPVWGLAGGPALSQLVADAIGVAPDRIAASDLMLHDAVAPAIGGASNELLFSARLDNLAMCHASITALAAAAPGAQSIAVVALFDHEEVGSNSAAGAGSSTLPRMLERLVPSREAFHQACARSTCVSADMSHAVHPNYASRHEPRHKPVLNGGPVIKTNTQQRYATNAATAAMFARLCRDEDVPVQHYAHRTDLPCGSTIGPITSTLLGIPTVDVGNPMLSMHSAREMAGTRDPALMNRVLARYLRS
ncbi:MAG: M18 family aminopeptidase [Deltaproteobacteria bacterium]|nr:M18 family aminopeptidase [Deltaproteobacteria bacterium]